MVIFSTSVVYSWTNGHHIVMAKRRQTKLSSDHGLGHAPRRVADYDGSGWPKVRELPQEWVDTAGD